MRVWPSRGSPGTGEYARFTSARANTEWQLVRGLLVFRAGHLIQFALTLPGITRGVTHPVAGIALPALVAAESTWFVYRTLSVRGYGGIVTARIELACGIAVLLGYAWILPPGNRASLASPLVALTTEFVSGIAIAAAVGGGIVTDREEFRPTAWSRQVGGIASSADQAPRGVAGRPTRHGRRAWIGWLVGATLAMAGAYAILVSAGDAGGLVHADAVIALTGYPLLAYLLWLGSNYLLRQADMVAQLSWRLAGEEHLRGLSVELHNHLENALIALRDQDGRDDAEMDRRWLAVTRAGERLRTYVRTGRYSEQVTFTDMLRRQRELAAQDGLTVTVSVCDSARDALMIRPDVVDELEPVVRAALINVIRHGGVDCAVLSVQPGVRPDTLEITILDEGHGLRDGHALAPGRGSLTTHRAILRRAGGDLVISSGGGSTEITIMVPLVPGGGTATPYDGGTAGLHSRYMPALPQRGVFPARGKNTGTPTGHVQ